MRSRRIEKINALIQETLAYEIQKTITAELDIITVTAANVSSDLRSVKVSIDVLGSEDKQKQIIKTLNEHKRQLQNSLAKLQFQYTPVINFAIDLGAKNVAEVEAILDNLKKDGKA